MVNNGNNGDEGGGEGADAQTTYTERMIDGASTRVGYYAIATGNYFHEKVAAIQKEAQHNGVSVNPEAVLGIWRKYLRMVSSVFSKHFGLVYRAVKAEHGDHAAYAMLGYELDQKRFYLANEAITRGHIIPCVAQHTGKTSESLLQEFQEVVNLDALTSIRRPGSKVASPKTTSAKPSTSTSTAASVGFNLEDLAVPPKGTLVRDVVLKLYHPLWDTIEGAQIWVDRKKRKNKAVLPPDVRKQFPLLKHAKDEELAEYVFGRATKPRMASLNMMMSVSGLELSSVERFTRPVKDKATKNKSTVR